MASLYEIYQAAWDAVDNWPALADPLFTLKIKFNEDDVDSPDEIEPSMSDLPCITIQPAGLDPQNYLTQTENWPFVLAVKVWTPGWKLEQPLDIYEQLTKAFRQSHPIGDAVPYLKRATGLYPEKPDGASFQQTRLLDGENGAPGTKVTLVTQSLVLRVNRNSFLP